MGAAPPGRRYAMGAAPRAAHAHPALPDDAAAARAAAGDAASGAGGPGGRLGAALDAVWRLAVNLALQRTSVVLADDRLHSPVDLPYSPRLVARLFTALVGGTRVRGPRPLMRLFATACRYRSVRPVILQVRLSSPYIAPI